MQAGYSLQTAWPITPPDTRTVCKIQVLLQSKEASLVKNLGNNNSAITSNDFDQCYDKGCVPISGLAARTQDGPMAMVSLSSQRVSCFRQYATRGLILHQVWNWHITESSAFGGSPTMGSKLMGLGQGQGSGAAPRTVTRTPGAGETLAC